MPTKKKLIGTSTTVTVGCGYSCRRLNLSKIFHPKPNKHNHHNHHNPTVYHHGYSSWTTSTATTLSPKYSDSTTDGSTVSSKSVQGFGWLAGNSLAVEKDSSDPYIDFRESMLQMMMEKEIYEKDDLRELLNCFLQLNSPYYHGIIVKAFTEILNNLPN